MCRNSKLAKAETIPAQMRSSKSREESRRVVMDRQLIDKLVERKTKNSHRIPFFLFCLFVCFLLLILRHPFEKYHKIGAKKTNEFKKFVSTRWHDTSTQSRQTRDNLFKKRQREDVVGTDDGSDGRLHPHGGKESGQLTSLHRPSLYGLDGWNEERRKEEENERRKKERKWKKDERERTCE